MSSEEFTRVEEHIELRKAFVELITVRHSIVTDL